MSDREARESFSDRFLDVVLDKGSLWLLIGIGIVALFVAGVQVGMAVAS